MQFLPHALALFSGMFFVLESAKLHHLVFYAVAGFWILSCRHCERSAAIRGVTFSPGLPRSLRSLAMTGLTWVIGAYIAYQALSLSWSPVWSGEEFGEVLRKGLLTLLWVLVLATVLSAENPRRIFWEIVITLASVSALLALYWQMSAAIPPERMAGLGRSLNPVQGASLYGWALVGAFCLWYKEKKEILWVLCCMALLLALLATGSRGALLAALVALSLFVFLQLKVSVRRKRNSAIALTAVIALLLAADWPQLIARGDSFRFAIWGEALAAWQQHPWLGLGYRAPFEQVLSNGQVIFQPHSIYITALYYGGIPGLLLLLGMLGMAAWLALRQHNITALALLTYGGVIGLVDYNLLLVNGDSEWLFFWLPIALSLTGQGTSQPSKCEAAKPWGLGPLRPQQEYKILHSLFSNGIGGTERHLADLANAQIRAGHQVTVMLRADRHPYDGPDSLRVWLMPEVEVVHAPRRWPLIPLWFMLRKLQPDIIHTHHRRDSRYLAMAAPHGVPVVATLHMPYRNCDYRRHQGLICVSPWQLADIPNLPGRKRVVIPNWIMPPPPVNEAECRELRRLAGVAEGEKLLGVVGRLTAEKGMEDLVDAFLQVNPPDVTLCIFGEGECRPEIERMLTEAGSKAPSNKVKLMGYESEIRRWYSVFDGFVLPSRYETFGLVLLEAMTAGLPILSTRTRGALDVLGGDAQISWAEVNHPEDLARALKEFLPKLGTKCDYPQLAQHQPEQAFARVEEFYRELLQQ